MQAHKTKDNVTNTLRETLNLHIHKILGGSHLERSVPSIPSLMNGKEKLQTPRTMNIKANK